ncbi:hypothetical protein niasHT_028602 [Heterodera trifolii]|uniref:Uncharacterized protein n=1 Tax=Heterodera trifolii TaxID=157864 RepID=A0ABD2KA79_9BILA
MVIRLTHETLYTSVTPFSPSTWWPSPYQPNASTGKWTNGETAYDARLYGLDWQLLDDDLSLTDELREDMQLVKHIEEEPCVNNIGNLEQQRFANSPLAENGGDNLPLLDGAQIEVGADPQTPLFDATVFSPPQMEKRQSNWSDN